MSFSDVIHQPATRRRIGPLALVALSLTIIATFAIFSPADATTTTVTVEPATASAVGGSQHTVHASISPAVAGLSLRLTVISGPNAGLSAGASTTSTGRVNWTYTGLGGPGLDTIVAWVDVDRDRALDPAEPRGQATVRWSGGTVTPSITLSPLTAANLIGTSHTLTATVSLAQAGRIVRFRVLSGPHAGFNARVLTNSSGQSAYSYFGSAIGSDSIVAWIDLDDDGVRDTNESRAFASKTWTGSSSTQIITLSPDDHTSLTGTTHILTSTLSTKQSGNLVRFRVTQGPNNGTSGAALTNSQGRATHSYLGTGGVGIDVLVSWLDLNNNGVRETNEPQATALQRWVTSLVAGSAFSLSPASDTNPVNTRHSMIATAAPAQRDLLARFEVTSGPNVGTRGSDRTNSSGRADLSYVGDEGPGTDTILAWLDFDHDGRFDGGEPWAIATKQWTAVAANSLVLSPSNDTNPVNTRHSMVATVAPAQRDLLVRFEVTSGPNLGTRGSDHTNSSGRADLSYVGDEGVGTDIIRAWIDLDRDGRVDTGEPQAVAIKQWTQVSVSTLSLTPASDQEREDKDHKVRAQLTPALEGVLVRFQIVSGPNQGETDSDRTDRRGRSTFKYRNDGGSGTDLILAWIDLDEDGHLDSGEHQANAVVTWLPRHDDDSLVAHICGNLGSYTDPSLPTLCNLVEAGQLSRKIEEIVVGIIYQLAGFDEKDARHWRRDRHH